MRVRVDVWVIVRGVTAEVVVGGVVRVVPGGVPDLWVGV